MQQPGPAATASSKAGGGTSWQQARRMPASLQLPRRASGGQDQARLLCPPRTGSRAMGPVGRKRRKAVLLGEAVARVAASQRCSPPPPTERICGRRLAWGHRRCFACCLCEGGAQRSPKAAEAAAAQAAAAQAARTCAHCRMRLAAPSAPTSSRACRLPPPSSCSWTSGPPSSCRGREPGTDAS